MRGVALQIALPAPPIDVDDPADWARSVLPADLRACVASAKLDEVRVLPGGSAGTGGVTALIGSIVPEGARPMWTIPVVVALVTLQHGTPRHTTTKVQWPDDVLIDGVSLKATRGQQPGLAST